jgi:SAM-dependent methyltransferase
MERSLAPELMDDPGLPEAIWENFHRELIAVHRLLGNTGAILDALSRNVRPIRRVLDVGCGNGALLDEIRRKLGVEVLGVDLRPPKRNAFGISIVEADAVRHPLPEADVALSLLVIHHLSEQDLIGLIRNVGRSVPRFVILDLVRHPVPLALFRVFLCPFFGGPFGADGRQSIRRAYTPPELHGIVEHALDGSGAKFEQTVTPFRSRQMIDISWR